MNSTSPTPHTAANAKSRLTIGQLPIPVLVRASMRARRAYPHLAVVAPNAPKQVGEVRILEKHRELWIAALSGPHGADAFALLALGCAFAEGDLRELNAETVATYSWDYPLAWGKLLIATLRCDVATNWGRAITMAHFELEAIKSQAVAA